MTDTNDQIVTKIDDLEKDALRQATYFAITKTIAGGAFLAVPIMFIAHVASEALPWKQFGTDFIAAFLGVTLCAIGYRYGFIAGALQVSRDLRMHYSKDAPAKIEDDY